MRHMGLLVATSCFVGETNTKTSHAIAGIIETTNKLSRGSNNVVSPSPKEEESSKVHRQPRSNDLQ